MTISFNQIFGKRSEYRVKDFPELPNIEGLQLAFGTADLYKKKRNDICFFYFKDGASFAGVYTKSAAKSHCITWNKKIKSKKIKKNTVLYHRDITISITKKWNFLLLSFGFL